MPRQSTEGTKQLGVEVDEGLMAELREFARKRRSTVRAVVEMALRRHLANPPPVPEVPPLPPVTSPVTSPGQRKRKK
jgi:hypothetical protein